MPTEPQFLYLTTTGRRSGARREIEIWFTRHGGRYYLIAEQGELAQWVRNVRVEPLVGVRVADATFTARARIVPAGTEAELVRRVQQLSSDKYGWGEGLVVELEPLPA